MKDAQFSEAFEVLKTIEPENFQAKIEKYLEDENIEELINFLSEVYGLTEEEDLGVIAQIFLCGYLTGQGELHLSDG